MGNCQTFSQTRALSRRKSKPLPIETIFKLPSKVPSWPPGEGFASGEIDLGPIRVRQISTFAKVWATHEGGPGNVGATFFEPSPIPEGFHMLGCYSQPNNKPLFGWVLVAKGEENDDDDDDDDDDEGSNGALAEPIDYTLVWSSEPLKIKRDGNGYIWLPTPPDGYKAAGFLVTDTPEKPPRGKVRCVRADLTEQCEGESWIWGPEGGTINANGFNIYTLRPTNRGTQALGVPVGAFAAQIGGANAVPPSLACLKNANSDKLYYSMPNLAQIEALFKAYSPLIYFHPDEKYLPSSVTWYFTNGALLYEKGKESTPSAIEPTGANLPQGGANDGEYWLDLPRDKTASERVKKGDLATAEVYLHAKPMFGSTYTDVAVWIFYPFNGPARAKVGPLNVPLGRIGEHIGDWEHVTLRVSNFSGEFERLYLSEHSKGIWAEASELEFEDEKPVAYASLHGHAQYARPGLVLQGGGAIGIRNDTAKSKMVMDTGEKFAIVAMDYLGGSSGPTEPPWLNYLRKWGPKIDYDTKEEAEKVAKILPGSLKKAFRKFVDGLPSEVFGEEGPTGPKVKGSWIGDEPY